MPQRQTALVAKQAASLDVISGAGSGSALVLVGNPPVEYVEKTSAIAASGQEHVKLTLKLWAEPHVSFKGRWHAIEDAGINPGRRITRSTFGLVVTRTRLRRIAKWGDRWVMLAHSSGPVAMPRIRQARQYVAEAGHNPSTIGLEVWVSTGEGGPDDWRRQFQAWNDADDAC